MSAAQLSNSLVAFGEAIQLAEEHELPGAVISLTWDADGQPDPEPWPGAIVVTDEELDARRSNIRLRMQDMDGLRKALNTFLHETEGSTEP